MNRIAKMEEGKRVELAEYYKEICESLELDSLTKARYINSTLGINGREWRKYVENMQHLYMYGYMEKMIIGTNKGYILTNDEELIYKFLLAKEHQFKSMAYNCYNLKKAVDHKDNYSIDDYIKDVYCV